MKKGYFVVLGCNDCYSHTLFTLDASGRQDYYDFCFSRKRDAEAYAKILIKRTLESHYS